MEKMKKILLIISIILNFGYSTTYLVPDDYNLIQVAIEASIDGDSIIVSPGLYSENIDFLGKEIVVTSLFEANDDSTIIGLTIIDAGEDGSVATFKNMKQITPSCKDLLCKMELEIIKTQMKMVPFIPMVVVSIAKKVARLLKAA